MNAIDFIRMSLESSKNWTLGLAEDMKNAPLTRPTPNGGNHPLWCLGHLAYSEANLISVYAKGEANPLAEWADLFQMGTTPSDDASVYPTIDEVLVKLGTTRAATLAYLDTITEADLDRPSQAEGEAQAWFSTVGACLAAIPIHYTYHGGQIADARRTAGRGVMMG